MSRIRNQLTGRLAGKGRWLWPAVTAVAIAIAAMSIVAAQTGGGDRSRDHDRGNHRNHDTECADLAALVGAADCEALKSALDDDQTLAQIAQSNNIEPQTVIDAMVAEMTAELDDKVESGAITEERAAMLRTQLTVMVSEGVNEGFGRDHGRHGFRALDTECAELATLVGAADCAALKSALDDDQTLAQIAESNGIEPQTVIDAMVAQMTAELDAKVESGDLTEERAAMIRTQITDMVVGFVNEGFDGEREHRGQRHGKGERSHDRFDAAECGELATLVGADDCATLKTAMRGGQTLAQIAESNGIEPQTVIDAMVAEMSAELDAKVDSGAITEERAAMIREQLTEMVTGFVNEGFDGERGRHGKAKRAGAASRS